MEVFYLKNLDANELELVKKIPALITILVGSSDDDLNSKEIHMGELSTDFRKNHGEPLVHEYFEWVSADYNSIFEAEWKKFKTLELKERMDAVSKEIEGVNELLPKLDKKFAHDLVGSWRGLARAIAHSSGGVLGRLAIAPEERDVMGLDMIHLQ